MEPQTLHIEFSPPSPIESPCLTISKFSIRIPDGGVVSRAHQKDTGNVSLLRVFPVGNGTWAGWITSESEVHGWVDEYPCQDSAMRGLHLSYAHDVIWEGVIRKDVGPTEGFLRAYEVMPEAPKHQQEFEIQFKIHVHEWDGGHTVKVTFDNDGDEFHIPCTTWNRHKEAGEGYRWDAGKLRKNLRFMGVPVPRGLTLEPDSFDLITARVEDIWGRNRPWTVEKMDRWNARNLDCQVALKKGNWYYYFHQEGEGACCRVKALYRALKLPTLMAPACWRSAGLPPGI